MNFLQSNKYKKDKTGHISTICQRLIRSIKSTINSLSNPLLPGIQHIPVTIKSNSIDMITLSHTRLDSVYTEVTQNFQRKKFPKTNQIFNFSWRQCKNQNPILGSKTTPVYSSIIAIKDKCIYFSISRISYLTHRMKQIAFSHCNIYQTTSY